MEKPAAVLYTRWSTGLLHDLDWGKFPTKQPMKTSEKILSENDYSTVIIEAIAFTHPGTHLPKTRNGTVLVCL